MNNLKANYISLHEAAKITNYSQDYISLLCRQKKLNGTKIGRNWVTTKQWIEDYINKTKGSGQNIIPVRIENNIKTKNEIINIKENTGTDLGIKENSGFNQEKYHKSLNSIKAYQSQIKNPVSNRFILTSLAASFVIVVFIFLNSYSLAINQSFLKYSKTVQNAKSIKYLSGLINSDLNLNNILKNEIGRVAGVEDLNEDGNTISGERNDLANEEKNGMIIVPLGGDKDSQENIDMINRISSSFSDEVKIKPSEDEASGIITSSNNPEDNYLYLMVPVKE
ncbi:MAG: helix-turn-helix domain-containing protein [Candidatus Pacebacteria bacterium]|nr:helix-turn-helix domain-containing protein [Candidatus Paceibacterota bacterium]